MAPRSSRPARDEGICPSRWHELRAAVEATGPLRVDDVNVPGAGSTLRITRPYPVITDNDRDVPYWSEIWPSGIELAGVIARDPNVLYARRVLELGPGVGVTAVAALRAGADLVLADSESGSLLFCAFNALDHEAWSRRRYASIGASRMRRSSSWPARVLTRARRGRAL